MYIMSTVYFKRYFTGRFIHLKLVQLSLLVPKFVCLCYE
jgi:hypothetical protein